MGLEESSETLLAIELQGFLEKLKAFHEGLMLAISKNLIVSDIETDATDIIKMLEHPPPLSILFSPFAGNQSVLSSNVLTHNRVLAGNAPNHTQSAFATSSELLDVVIANNANVIA
ncbi:hypothetical protein H5410_019072 [Solanum commersonii]|uniref:Uncharacterized protein n=1 Tax=Solanum commersonii TaxID=4109 RepID=A0A9J6A4C6_SOLCO|nr:hypothetical protein H5410_019072 [Solanum commersonii]